MRLAVALCGVALSAGGASGAFVVGDSSFFASRPHTFLDFETRGDGSPVGLGFLEFEFFGEDEYLGQGLRFTAGQHRWDTVQPPSIGTPLDPEGLGGLGDAVATFGNVPTVYAVSEGAEIVFAAPVRSFGIGVVQFGFPNSAVPDPNRTTMITAFDASGEVLGHVSLWLDTIDGHFGAYWMTDAAGNDWYSLQYGFLGLASDSLISKIRFDNTRDSLFDSFYFSSIPSPGGGVLLAIGAPAVLRRRRRQVGMRRICNAAKSR
jgi:hypothetical protein